MGDSVKRLALALLGLGCTVTALGGQSDLAPGNTLHETLVASQPHEYRLTLRSGDYAQVAVDQRSVDAFITVFDPAGKEIAQFDASVIGDPEIAEWVAAAGGSYRIRIAAEPLSPTGEMDITVRGLESAMERHRVRVAARGAFAQAMAARGSGARDDIRRAIDFALEALGHWRAAGDRNEETAALSALGLLYIDISDRLNALKYTSAALSVAESTRDAKLTGRALEAVGRVHNTFGDKRLAVEYCERALPLLRAAGDRAGEANALDNAGVALSGLGERRRALVYYNQAAEIFRSLQDIRMVSELQGNIAVAYDNLGEYERALEGHNSELELARALKDRTTEAVTLNNIANAYTGLGNFQKALDTYTQALDINRALQNEWNVSINLNNIAWVYGQLGDRQHALKFYEASLELTAKVSNARSRAITLNNIGTIHAALGNYSKAIAIHSEALSMRRSAGDTEGEANSLFSLGSAYEKAGDWAKARDHMQRALTIHRSGGNRYFLSRSLRGSGSMERKSGNPGQARAYLEESLAISRAIRDPKGESEALAELARVEKDLANDQCAAERARESLAVLESIRSQVMSPSLRASFVASVHDVQELEIEALMRLHARQPDAGFGAAALLASERGRARSLLEFLNESGVEIRSGVDAGLLTRESELRKLLSAKADVQTRLLSNKRSAAEAEAIAKELDALTVEYDQLQSHIRQASPQYAALTHAVPVDLKQIQASVLDPDTVLLEYALGSGRSALWVVTQSSMQAFELPPAGEIDAIARRVYDLLTVRNRKLDGETPAARAVRVRQADSAYSEAARQLGRMLLEPAAPFIAGKRLLIVAEGVLQYLPFGALPEPVADAPLMVNHEIATAPSASVVAQLRQENASRKAASKQLALFADPVFQVGDPRIQAARTLPATHASEGPLPEFARLRFSRMEAADIARMADPAQTLQALDFDASRETALNPDLGDYRLVHFATHSILDNQHPELSGVVLSLVDRRGRPQNGFLRLYDIYNLRLGADLVVLSACSTALGEEIKGEGLIGLTRGFLFAGAPRVVATLWEIDDRTTREAMKLFYEGMLARGERPAAALRAAQLALWKSKGSDAPYYWAAFTMQGEWR